MKKIISHILLTAILVLPLSACGRTNSQEEPVDSGGILDASAVLKLGGQDNSLDAYSAAANVPLEVENPADALDGGGERIFMGISRAYHFKKHLFENVDECWDELAYVTVEGQAGSTSFDREHPLWDAGPVSGSDHYVTFDYELQENQEDYRYFLTERKEDYEALWEFPLDFLDGNGFSEVIMSLSGFAVDQSGMAHLLRQTDEGTQYLLLSQTGEVLAEYLPNSGSISGLVPLYDGRVAFSSVTYGDNDGTALLYMDAEIGRPVQLASLEKLTYCLNLLDEDTLLYADEEGVYRSRLSGKKPELLYRWVNHGILTSWVPAIQADKEGRISLLYESSGKYSYLCLEPTTEEVELCEITLAVSPHSMSAYQRLATEFNRRYPTCHIEVQADCEKTALLTELTAGKGPVLIDTFLTGFEEQEKLWEPLDNVMEQLGITEELPPAALELGKINGAMYGVVTDFRLRTLVTWDPNLKDWDYDTFIQCVENRPELEALFDQYDGDYRVYFIIGFLSHGIENSYFLDAEDGTMSFDSDRFRRTLELAEQYCVHEESIRPGASLREGKVLCNALEISKPEHLALYRICYGEDANYIGYPTKDGAAHFIESGGGPLAIRKTATRKEKEVAAAFLNLCLSYEGQSLMTGDLNFALSVRRDVLEEQIASMTKDTAVFTPYFDEIVLGDDLNVELDRAALLDLIEKAQPIKYFPREFRDILSEELDQYLSGAITEDKLIDNLESRVGLYLGERN